MHLRRLEVTSFRNIARAAIEPSLRTTVVVGPNGQGKTNLLEAIYVLATLKPLRAARFAELVRFGESAALVRGAFANSSASREVAVTIRDGSRSASVDGKAARSLEDYFGGLSVVAFTPDDLGAVKGGPDRRRRLIDRATFNRFPAYLSESRDYHRALRSRNRLLRDQAAPAALDAFSEPLAKLGARLVTRRRTAVDELAPRFRRAYAAIAPGDGEPALTYAPAHLPEAPESEGDLGRAMLREMSRRVAHDVERGFTSVGPHVDDLGVQLGGKPARAYASQGQQRALVIGFKIAEIENLRQVLGRPPILLLDDVSSELDPERNAFLMNYLAESGAQIFLSTTDARLVATAAGRDALTVRVARGEFAPET